jgi:outer membrane protein OmpA-like peptidoglycan-associated protein
MANKADDSAWMSELFKLASSGPSKVNATQLVSAVVNPGSASYATSSLLDSGKKLLSFAFGDNRSAIFETVGGSTGLGSGVVSSLMTIAAPLMMNALGRRIRDDHMDAAGLRKLLIHEGEGVRDLLPVGISSLLNVAPSSTLTATPPPVALGEIPEPPRSRAWWWLIPAVLLLPLLLYLGYRGLHRVVPASVELGRFVARTLPGNVSLRIPENGLEARLLAFLEDRSRALEPPTWFDFDRLLFDTDSVTLRPESDEQVNNIAAILKAYPNVHIRIGGFTDSTGNSQSNLNLSQRRANSVMEKLVGLGISPDRMEAVGYGEQFPVADNSTAEGRAKNRRVSIRVTQK